MNWLVEHDKCDSEGDVPSRRDAALRNTPANVLDQMAIKDGRNDFKIAMKEHIWGTYGSTGNGRLKWLRLCECSTTHLENIITTQHHIQELTKRIIVALLAERYAKSDNEEAEEVIRLGREHPLNPEEKQRLMTAIVKTIQGEAKNRGDTITLSQLAGDPEEVARQIISKDCEKIEDDVLVYGSSVLVYCTKHLRPHSTGWCSVPPSGKVKLDALTVEEAYAECRSKGFALYEDRKDDSNE